MTLQSANSIFTSTHAIIFGVCEDECLIGSIRPLCMLPLGPKPILQHMVESAVRLGVRTVDVVISEGVQEVRQLLGDGKRFGISLRIHLVADAQHPYSVFRFLCANRDPVTASRTLILHTSQLAFVPNPLATDSISSKDVIVLTDAQQRWTGVAELPCDSLRSLDCSALTYDQLADFLSESDASCFEATDVLSLNTPSQILESQVRVLNAEFPELVENYRSAEKGIWIGRNTRIHPTAVIVSPAFISENCDIDAGATIGPGAWLGERTLVGTGAVVSNSMVMPLSSVGEELTLQDAIVSGSQVLNTRLGISLNLDDDLLLGDLSRKTLTQKFCRLLSRLAGLMLTAMTAPLLGAYWLFSGRPLRLVTREFLCTPAPSADFLWRTLRLTAFVDTGDAIAEVSPRRQLWQDLFKRIIPALPQVAMGRIRLCGVTPITITEARDLPEYWKPILLSAPSGLITEPLTQSGPQSSIDERCCGDIWFTMTALRLRSVRLLARYIRALFLGPPVRRAARQSRSRAQSGNAMTSRGASTKHFALETEHAER